MRKVIVVLLLLLSCKNLKAQDFIYTNYLMSPIYLNPSLAGVINGNNRIVINYRDQYPGITNAYKFGGFSFDQKSNLLNGAIFLSYDYSNEGDGFYKKNNIGFGYAFHGIKFRKNQYRNDLQFSLAIKANYTTRSIDYDRLIFYDQIDIENGLSSGLISEASIPIYNHKGFFDFATGLTLVYKNFVGGFAIHHLDEPNESLISTESILKRRYNLHLTYYGKFGKKRNTRKLFTPSINIYYQDKLPVVMFGAQFKYMFFTIGQWYRTATYLDGGNTIMWTFVLDTKQHQEDNNWKIGFSYDFNLLGIGARNTYGSMELNLIYQSKNNRTRRDKLKCPEDFW